MVLLSNSLTLSTINFLFLLAFVSLTEMKKKRKSFSQEGSKKAHSAQTWSHYIPCFSTNPLEKLNLMRAESLSFKGFKIDF